MEDIRNIMPTRIAYNFQDLTGQQFHSLIVVNRWPSEKDTLWRCRCSCGNWVRVRSADLKRGHTKSCGCHKIHLARLRKTHGMSNGHFYWVWQHMLARCNRTTSKDYPYYGGRGIKVEWKSFE